MKLSLSLVLVTLAALGAAQGPARCSNIRVRRNAASLSQQEWRSISNVLQRMHQDGLITSFGAAHDRLFNRIHGNTCFFPFHRRFLIEFENIARRYDPNFTVPYWDATQSYRNPASDPLLTSTALGTNGQNQDRCLTDGIQANTQLSYPNNHCLRRNWNNGNSISPWYAPEIISSYIRSDTSLSRFRENIEYSIHGAVHLGLAGEMDSGYAAHDFTFMVHHANLDRLWWDWQNAHNSFLMYDGTGSNGPASIRDIIPDDNSVPFGGSTVESVMVLGFGNVCYTYDSSSNPPQSYPARPGSNDIDRFFPGLNGGTSALRRRAYQEKKERCAQGKPLTFPDRLTPEWIKMHGFDPERVEMFHNNACQIVELLNNSTYTSPY
ncbi:hypothetical protein BX661DRAFT_205928 [Kickxella alabastrina]|uniref:uncharacterized protein n=1 Tax=Kickxella alabastrina TaxID=61397 RepID=UPI0022203D73|nr:uncharacterized protein BX661DRAFT_205928 [Kickxella alabastrina]KAI7826314.1 hypothetical protein BX661DRAFT_205928 [Kickxella alabastrina]